MGQEQARRVINMQRLGSFQGMENALGMSAIASIVLGFVPRVPIIV